MEQQGQTPGLLWFPASAEGNSPPGIPVLGQEPSLLWDLCEQELPAEQIGDGYPQTLPSLLLGEDLGLHLSPCGADASPAFHPCSSIPIQFPKAA